MGHGVRHRDRCRRDDHRLAGLGRKMALELDHVGQRDPVRHARTPAQAVRTDLTAIPVPLQRVDAHRTDLLVLDGHVPLARGQRGGQLVTLALLRGEGLVHGPGHGGDVQGLRGGEAGRGVLGRIEPGQRVTSGVEHRVEDGSDLVLVVVSEERVGIQLLPLRSTRGITGGACFGLCLDGQRGQGVGHDAGRAVVVLLQVLLPSNEDDESALLATDLDPLRANLVITDHVLRAAAVADKTHGGGDVLAQSGRKPWGKSLEGGLGEIKNALPARPLAYIMTPAGAWPVPTPRASPTSSSESPPQCRRPRGGRADRRRCRRS